MGPTSGAFTRFLDKASGIALAPAPELTGHFRLILQMPDKTTATIDGSQQKPSASTVRPMASRSIGMGR